MRRHFSPVKVSARIVSTSRPFSSPEPVVSLSRGWVQIKPTGSGDENASRRGRGFCEFDVPNVSIFVPVLKLNDDIFL